MRSTISIKILNPQNIYIYRPQEHLTQIEFERSLKSDFELRHEKELVIADLQKKGTVDKEIIESVQQTAQDLTDAWKEEFKAHQLAGRQTDADRKKTVKSVDRKLDKTLFLLIEQQIGERKHMLLPQGKRAAGESLRQTAERVLKTNVGPSLSVQFYGNAPCGFYKYKYPTNERKQAVGAKIFFFRATFQTGHIDAQTSAQYEWQDDVGLQTKLNPNYFKSISQFMVM